MAFLLHQLEIYKEFEKGSVSEFQSSGFSNSLQPKAILLWLKMEVSTRAGYKLPTEGIAILNYFQSPNKFSRMEICLYPHFLSPGDDTCFTHYESYSPFPYTKAKENEQNVLIDWTTLGSAHDIRCITIRLSYEKYDLSYEKTCE